MMEDGKAQCVADVIGDCWPVQVIATAQTQASAESAMSTLSQAVRREGETHVEKASQVNLSNQSSLH